MVNVVAIPANPALANGLEDFMSAVRHDRSNSAELFISMVDHLTDRMLSLFMIEPSRMIELSSTQSKVIDFAVSTAGKASHMLTRQIYKKISNAEFAPVLKNLEALYWPAGDDNGQQAHVHFPVTDSFANEFHAVAELCAARQGSAQIDRVAAVMDQLSNQIIDNFYVANSKVVKIGFVTQKALDIGIDGSRKAIQAVNHKVLKGLSDEHLAGFMAHYAPIVRQR